jgi:hypothetical protein
MCILDKIKDLGMMILEYALDLIDICGAGIGKITGLGDIMKLIACESCALTSIVTDTLADFVSGFEPSTCIDILDKGTAQCAKWGMGDITTIGPMIFESVPTMLQLVFGLVQVIPALAEIAIELAIFIGSSALNLFPNLIEDFFEIFMWFVSSSDVVSTIETLFEAFDQIIEETEDTTNEFFSSDRRSSTDK